MLEHIRPEGRAQVLDELVRTARRRLVVGCPTGNDALEVDRRLAQMLDSRGESYASSWLEEHLSNGFPTSIELEAALARHGRVRRLQNENLRTHELLMRAEMTRRPRKLTDALDRLLRPVLFDRGSGWRRPFVRAIRGFDRGRTYRTIIVVDRP